MEGDTRDSERANLPKLPDKYSLTKKFVSELGVKVILVPEWISLSDFLQFEKRFAPDLILVDDFSEVLPLPHRTPDDWFVKSIPNLLWTISDGSNGNNALWAFVGTYCRSVNMFYNCLRIKTIYLSEKLRMLFQPQDEPVPSNLRFWFDDWGCQDFDPDIPLREQIKINAPIRFLPITYNLLQFNWLNVGIGNLELGDDKGRFPDLQLLQQFREKVRKVQNGEHVKLSNETFQGTEILAENLEYYRDTEVPDRDDFRSTFGSSYVSSAKTKCGNAERVLWVSHFSRHADSIQATWDLVPDDFNERQQLQDWEAEWPMPRVNFIAGAIGAHYLLRSMPTTTTFAKASRSLVTVGIGAGILTAHRASKIILTMQQSVQNLQEQRKDWVLKNFNFDPFL